MATDKAITETKATVHPRHRTRALMRLRDQRRQHRLYRSRLANLIHLSLTRHPSPDPGVVLTDQALRELLKTHPRQTRQASPTSRATATTMGTTNPTGTTVTTKTGMTENSPTRTITGMIVGTVRAILGIATNTEEKTK